MLGDSGPLAGPGPPLNPERVVGWIPPTPPDSTLILGPAKPPETRPRGAEFLRFFGPCGAKSRGGGGAPPTTLILLRNQRSSPRARASPPPGASGAPDPGQPASPAGPDRQNRANFLPFSVVACSCALERGEARWGASIACGDVSHGRGPLRSPRPCPLAEVLTDGQRGDAHQALVGSSLLCEALPDLAGRSSRRAAFGSRKRPPPSRNLTVLRGLPSLP